MAVVAPIPSISETTAVMTKPGDFRNCRKAKRRSWLKVFMRASPEQTAPCTCIDGETGPEVDTNYRTESSWLGAGQSVPITDFRPETDIFARLRSLGHGLADFH